MTVSARVVSRTETHKLTCWRILNYLFLIWRSCYEQEPVGEDGLTTWLEAYDPEDAPLASYDWTGDAYAAVQDQEQLAQDDGEYQWGDSSAYDPTLWAAGENGDTYTEDVEWTYGALDEGAAANEDEDNSRQCREGSPLSTNSIYTIDLHLSSRTSTAETDQPSGMRLE
ncbi:hypothetical protein P3T76_015141 [Phytophthora citrophthora]|uniref:Uncharacterized protein n=1 Tax=Phytophthora citrophthora TaxID=4793 RepID=A0AAD9FZY2_9STRA|nr:hypothetical protein P3T76_015141 [Phytophthora citrophthora]